MVTCAVLKVIQGIYMNSHVREMRNQWNQADWKRDIERYEYAKAKLAEHEHKEHFFKLCEHWRENCNRIADKYPSAKLQKFGG
mgnify:CR=1 FL=1